MLRSMAMFTLMSASLPAFAAPRCGERALVLDTLAARYGETLRSTGQGPDGAEVDVFASDVTGTWTITVTLPDGTTCLLASGHHYAPFTTPQKPGRDA